MASANLFQNYLQPARSVVDYSNDYARADALKNQNALQSLNLQQQQAVTAQSLGERNALQRIAAQSGGDRAALITGLRNSGLPGLMTQADSLEKSGADLQTAQSMAAKNTADAAEKTQGLGHTNYTQAMQKVLSFQTPADAAASLNAAVSSGKIDMQHATMMARAIPQNDPEAFDAWKRQWAIGIADPAKMAELMAPHINTMNTGGAQVTQAVSPITLKPTTLSTVQNTASPGEVLTARTAGAQLAESKRHNTATEGLEAVKADPFGALGVNKNAPAGSALASTLSGEDYLKTLPPAVANQVKMLSEGRMPITAMSARSPQMMQLLSMASQYEPGTDATTYVQRAQTVKDFAPGGKDAQQITNLNTALHHAGQLSSAIDNLDNSNIMPGIINPASNLIAQKIGGSTAQGVYKQKADALSSELRKVYAAGGGGSLAELKDWQESFDANASKDQQKAYLQSGMELLVGALQAKKDAYQRGMGPRAQFGQFITPESQSVLSRLAPAYAATFGGQPAPADSAPAGVVPADIQAIIDRHGKK